MRANTYIILVYLSLAILGDAEKNESAFVATHEWQTVKKGEFFPGDSRDYFASTPESSFRVIPRQSNPPAPIRLHAFRRRMRSPMSPGEDARANFFRQFSGGFRQETTRTRFIPGSMFSVAYIRILLSGARCDQSFPENLNFFKLR